MSDPSQTTAGIHRGDLGMQRSRIAPLLTGEDLAELLALAGFCVSAGGSLCFGKASKMAVRLKALRLVEWVPQPEINRSTKLHRLTKLGWLTLLTRAESEMRHLLPSDEGSVDVSPRPEAAILDIIRLHGIEGARAVASFMHAMGSDAGLYFIGGDGRADWVPCDFVMQRAWAFGAVPVGDMDENLPEGCF